VTSTYELNDTENKLITL